MSLNGFKLHHRAEYPGQRLMDNPVFCPQHTVCSLALCRLFPPISCLRHGLSLSLVLESCNVLGSCQILDTAVAIKGFPFMTPVCAADVRQEEFGWWEYGWTVTELLHTLLISIHMVQNNVIKRPHPGKIPSLDKAPFFLPHPRLTHSSTLHLPDSLSLAPKYNA